ncbi:MAG: hypothetical protein WC998_05870 [Candidatus Paceibacterota bacterium]
MLLQELVDAFKKKYQLECFKLSIKPMLIGDKLTALMLSEVVGDIQKTFGVMQLSLSKDIVVGTDKYDLTSSVMEIENVKIGTTTLVKKSVEWLQEQNAQSGNPVYYTLINQNAIPQIWLYPNPNSADNGMIIYYKPNSNYYSPSSTEAGDFGDYGIAGTEFSGNTVFPAQYDKLMLLGLVKQLFARQQNQDIHINYEKEKSLLLVKQFNGEKFDYDPEWGE